MPKPSSFLSFMVQMESLGFDVEYTESNKHGLYATFLRGDKSFQTGLPVNMYTEEWGADVLSTVRMCIAQLQRSRT